MYVTATKAAMVTTVLTSFGFIDPGYLYLNWDLVIHKFQVLILQSNQNSRALLTFVHVNWGADLAFVHQLLLLRTV